ncbi:MAG: AEC family transporter [Nitrospira sp.]|nr:AEC family transporter [Nitrospira sp.]
MPATLQAFIAIFFLGALLRSFGLLGKMHAERLASFVFSISLPATILVSLDHVTFTPTAWKLPVAACLVTLTMLLCSWQVARRLHLPRPTQGGFLLGTGCINSVYFAYPVVLATFDDQGLARAILFDLGQTTLTLTVIYAIAVGHGTSSTTARSALVRFVASPPLWALCGSLLLSLFGIHLHAWLRQVLTPLHFTTTPLASLVLGLSISFAVTRRTLAVAVLGVVMRMAGGLLLGLGAAWVLNLTGIERAIVVLIAAMPSAVTAVIFAADTGLDEHLVTSIVALSICMGIALLPWLPQLMRLLE